MAGCNATAYLETRRQELEDKQTELIVYCQAEAMRDLLKVQHDAMQPVSHGKVTRKKRYRDKETGEERDPDPTKVVNAGDCAEPEGPPESEGEPPRVVIIGRE